MDINKVEYNGENGTETLIDLTADTVTPETLVKGATAHDKSGANITGTADYAIPSTSTTSPLTDSADALVQGLTVYGHSRTSKNLLEITAESQTINGVTFTVDKAAGTITANGTATNNIEFNLSTKYSDYYSLPNGKYFHNSAVFVINKFVSGQYSQAFPDEFEITDTIKSGKMYIYAKKNTTYSNTIFRPILCTAADYEADPSFEPYFEGIKSVGGDGLTVTTANSDNTVKTSAEFTTALPLRGISDTIRDKLICTGDSKQVETVCGKIRLADLSWEITNNLFIATLPINSQRQMPGGINALCSKYAKSQTDIYPLNKEFTANNYWISTTQKIILIRDDDYTTVSDFVASLGDTELVYELATPVTTPLTTTEISAFRGLRTYDSTTNITISDEPDFEFNYLKNSDNGQAVADVQKDLQGQIDELKIKTLTYTGTGTSTNTITFPEIPVCIFSFVNKQRDSYGNFNWTNPFTWDSPYITIYYTSSSSGSQSSAVSYTDNTMTLTGSDAGLAMNRSDTEYNIYYI